MRLVVLVSVLAVAGSWGAARCAHAEVTTWSFGSASLQYVGGTVDDPRWVDYLGVSPAVASSSLTEGVRLTGAGAGGAVFSLLGSEFNPGIDPGVGVNRLYLTGTGTVDGNSWMDPEYFVTTRIRAAVELSGGFLDLYLVSTEISLLDAGGVFLDGVGSGQDPGVVGAGFHPFELTAMDVFNQDHPEARQIRWGVSFEFDWTGYSASDTLEFSMPGPSIDIVANVPSPGVAFVFAAATLARRRRAGRSG